MGELVLLENELINIYEGNEKEQIVSGRELHEFLEVKTKYADWFKRMLAYGFAENIDFVLVTQKRETNNPKNPITMESEHYLKLDMAKEISMIQRNDKGKMARQYFIKVEKKYREMTNQAPMTMEDLIIHNAQLLKETRLKQEEQERKLKQLENQQSQHQNKVIEMTEYITKAPDFKVVEQNINTYARRSGLPHAKVRTAVYKKIEDLHGVDINSRIKNARKKIQDERVASGKSPYKESTLNQKVSGTDIIKELKLEKSIIEILMGMTAELDKEDK